MKKAFTIIELMVVVAIIGILLGIVVTASANSIRLSRNQRALALCKCVKQGIDNYRAQKDEWPGGVIKDGQVRTNWNSDGYNNQSVIDRYTMTASDVKDVCVELVRETVENHNPMLDISALFVCQNPGEGNSRDVGYDFMEWVRGSKRKPKRGSYKSVYYGYPETNRGWFRRFNIVYSNMAQEMEVTRQ